jgi:hypothetical protein
MNSTISSRLFLFSICIFPKKNASQKYKFEKIFHVETLLSGGAGEEDTVPLCRAQH